MNDREGSPIEAEKTIPEKDFSEAFEILCEWAARLFKFILRKGSNPQEAKHDD